MARVLIWNRIHQGSELDIFTPTNYENLYHHVNTAWNGRPQNWGNRIWFQGIYSALDTGENQYDFWDGIVDAEKINSVYDFIILSMANIFNPEYAEGMRNYAEMFAKIRIPIYVIACGVQANSYDDLPRIIDAIGADASLFIKSVYKTGGEFALRGYFTKEFFDHLGFSSAVVTGCPSLFQLGPEFQVPMDKVEHSQIKPVFNGFPTSVSQLLKAYPESVFIDQCDYFQLIYNPDFLKHVDYQFELMFENNYGVTSAQLMAEGRLQMIADMNDWWQYLRHGNFNYSFGSRIHGTIMALLSGMPATILTIDSRTREMAEFFDLPMCPHNTNDVISHEKFLELYDQADYTAFNHSFHQKFDAYERFLSEHGIVSFVNCNNRFFGSSGSTKYLDAIENRKDAFREFSKKLDRDRYVLKVLNEIRKIKNQLKGNQAD